MRNEDMPAMPTKLTVQAHSPRGSGYPSSREVECAGLTKREMIAMHMSGHILASLNYGAANGEFDYPSFEELANQSVQYADALLRELEK